MIWLTFMIESLLLSQCVRPGLQREMITKWNLCEYNADCDLPQVCCPGVFINYCCDIGGHMRRRRRMPDLPNITFPIPLPKPVPAPAPVPIPIPIPVN